MESSGYFLVSLDYELQWGSFDKVVLDENKKRELDNTLELITKILKQFGDNNIAATWAVVGMMFCKNKDEWEHNIPTTIPLYKNTELSPYQYFQTIENIKEYEKYFFALDSINAIINTVKQELATHTYSHYYCLEQGQTSKNFKADLAKAKQLMEQQNCKIDSLILPRNQFNAAYNSVCNELDIATIRTNPTSWYWKAGNDNILRRIFRLLDTFNLFSYSKCIHLGFFNQQNLRPYFLPASRFFRSWKPNSKIVNHIKLLRIKLEMTYAAKHKKYYHIWWHPENFGNHPNECLQELKSIVQHYLMLQNKYDFKSVSMSEFGEIIKANNAHNS